MLNTYNAPGVAVGHAASTVTLFSFSFVPLKKNEKKGDNDHQLQRDRWQVTLMNLGVFLLASLRLYFCEVKPRGSQ